MAAAMLSRLPGMEKARIGTTCSISESRRLSASRRAVRVRRTPSKSCAPDPVSRISLCSLTLAPNDRRPGALPCAPLVPGVLERGADGIEQDPVAADR